MNSSKGYRGTKNNLKLNNISGSYFDEKENYLNENYEGVNSRRASQKGGHEEKEREFGRDITNFVNNYQDYAVNNSKDLNCQSNQNSQINQIYSNYPNYGSFGNYVKPKVSSITHKKNLSIITNQPNYVFKSFFKKEGNTIITHTSSTTNKLSHVPSMKFIPNHPNTCKNKDLLNMNLNPNPNPNSNPMITPSAAQNGMFFNGNGKINNFCRQKKNTSFNLEYPLGRNPSLNAKPESKFDSRDNRNKSKTKRNSSAKPKTSLNLIQIPNNKENIDMNSAQNYFPENVDSNHEMILENTNDSAYSVSQTVENTLKATSKQSHLIYIQCEKIQVELGPEPENFLLTEENYPNEKNQGKSITEQSQIQNLNNTVQVQVQSNPISIYNDENKPPSSIYLPKKPGQDLPSSMPGQQLLKNFFSAQDEYLKIPEHLKEYLEDIYVNLITEESDIIAKLTLDYLPSQTDINEQMRSILLDWLVEVHLKFQLKDETLFLAVAVIDLYLGIQHIPRSKLQLLGVAALMVACKQEEILTPHVKDFVYITDQAYSKEEVLFMEREVLKTLEFKLIIPTPLRFYELIAQFFNFNKKEFMFGRYLLEITLVDYGFQKYLPSLLACTAAYITMKYFSFSNYQGIYSNFFNSNSNATVLKECAKEICNLLDNAANSMNPNVSAVKRKFARKEFCQVSNLSL